MLSRRLLTTVNLRNANSHRWIINRTTPPPPAQPMPYDFAKAKDADKTYGASTSERLQQILSKPAFSDIGGEEFMVQFTPEMVAQDHPQDVLAWWSSDGQKQHFILVRPDAVPRIAYYLSTACFAKFDRGLTVAIIDQPNDAQRFEVHWMLSSSRTSEIITIVTKVRDGQPVKSISWLFSAFEYREREQYEAFGVIFEYHPDLRKYMLDHTIEGFPFRKDYPLTGFQEIAWSHDAQAVIINSPPQIEVEYRDFQEWDTDWEMSFNERSNPLDMVSHLLFPSMDLDTPELAALKTDAWSAASQGNFDNMGFVDRHTLSGFQAAMDVPDEDPDEHHPRINDEAEY